MKTLILLIALVSIKAHAMDDVPMYSQEPAREAQRLEPILETPKLEPIEYSPKPFQSDESWTRSMEQLDSERRARLSN